MRQDSSVGTATRYALDGPVRAKFSAPVQTHPQWVPLVFPDGKTAGAWCSPPTPSSHEIKERVELYLYSPSEPSWPVLGQTLPFTGKNKNAYMNLASNIMERSRL